MMNKPRLKSPLVLAALVFSLMSVSVNGEEYRRKPGVSGTIRSVGSDTLANLMTFWGDEFRQVYPNVNFQIQASGSSTAPPALTEGTADVGPMSRELKASEESYFASKHGYKPLALKVGIDAIALFVGTNNDLPGLNLQQVDSIFSVTRYCGGKGQFNLWSELRPSNPPTLIQLFGRNSVSGTYGLFKKIALCGGDFRPTVNEQPGSASVVQSVAYTDGAIGYAAFGYKTAGVRSLPIALTGSDYVPVNIDTIASGQYPLSRFLYIVVNKSPNKPLPKVTKEFLTFVLSKQGQSLVSRDGYIAMPDAMVSAQLALLEP